MQSDFLPEHLKTVKINSSTWICGVRNRWQTTDIDWKEQSHVQLMPNILLKFHEQVQSQILEERTAALALGCRDWQGCVLSRVSLIHGLINLLITRCPKTKRFLSMNWNVPTRLNWRGNNSHCIALIFLLLYVRSNMGKGQRETDIFSWIYIQNTNLKRTPSPTSFVIVVKIVEMPSPTSKLLCQLYSRFCWF